LSTPCAQFIKIFFALYSRHCVYWNLTEPNAVSRFGGFVFAGSLARRQELVCTSALALVKPFAKLFGFIFHALRALALWPGGKSYYGFVRRRSQGLLRRFYNFF